MNLGPTFDQVVKCQRVIAHALVKGDDAGRSAALYSARKMIDDLEASRSSIASRCAELELLLAGVKRR